MKVVWVTNHFLPDAAAYLGENIASSGSWLVETVKEIVKNEEIELFVITPTNLKDSNFRIGNIIYYGVNVSNIDKFLKPTKNLKLKINNLLEEINPDIIHLQGSEFAYHQAFTSQKRYPTVISIQGLISQISLNRCDRGNITYKDIICRLKLKGINFIIFLMFQTRRNWYRSKAEIQLFKNVSYRIGRTEWDNLHTYFYNKNSKYYYLQEKIRSSFINQKWELGKCDRNTIFCAGGISSPLKGAHILVEALALVKEKYPDIIIKFPGDSFFEKKSNHYSDYLMNIILRLDMKENIVFLGKLSAEQMAEEFLKSHIFLLGSSLENSSNTLGEALTLGVPSVVPYVGGLPSLADNNKEVLYYNYPDIESIAWKVMKLFEDDTLSKELSLNSRKRSSTQYKNESVTTRLKEIYSDIINDNLLYHG